MPKFVQLRRAFLSFGVLLGTSGLVLGGAQAAGAASGTAVAKTHLAISSTAPVSGQHLQFYASVVPASPTGAPPTGTVTFAGAISPSIVVTLTHNPKSGRQSAVAVASFPAGTYTVTATYSGDSTYASGTAASTTFTVKKAATTTAVSATKGTTPGRYAVTARIRPVAPSRGFPTGTAVFTIDNVTLAPVTLTSGSNATVRATFQPGPHSVSVHYSGDADYTASTGTTSFTA